MKPLLAITMGDINGVGPEVLVRALGHPDVFQRCTPVVIGSNRVLEQASAVCKVPIHSQLVEEPAALHNETAVQVIDAGAEVPEVRPGTLDPLAGRSAIEWIRRAITLCLSGKVQGMVTCPINKECIHRAGFPYTGHTELVAEMTQSPDYRMCLFAGTMRIVHITSHLSLRDALDAVKAARIVRSVQIADEALRRMGLTRPRIAVAGLNPHAGEAGAFGREEIEEIAPAIASCRDEGLECSGPYPPDTVFRRMRDGEFDVVIALYHDQGHIPLKLIAMDEGVNVTLGIPIVRTSVDHGTAFDIAWQAKAREDSLCAAIELAARLTGCPCGHPE